jgi:hypothetical protein
VKVNRAILVIFFIFCGSSHAGTFTKTTEFYNICIRDCKNGQVSQITSCEINCSTSYQLETQKAVLMEEINKYKRENLKLIADLESCHNKLTKSEEKDNGVVTTGRGMAKEVENIKLKTDANVKVETK